MTTLTYYLYNSVPGAHPTWTLAVLATSQADAGRHVKIYNGGGVRAGVVEAGKVKASCGAVTAAAVRVLEGRNR